LGEQTNDQEIVAQAGTPNMGNIKPNSLTRSKLMRIEVPGDIPASWYWLDSKEAVEDHISERNVENFLHAGTTSFGYTALGEELGHTGDSPMADAIHAGTLEHPSLSDKAILMIVKQLKQHPLLHEIINPIVTVEDFRSSFQHVPEKTASSLSERHMWHYKAYIDLNDEHTVLLTEVHAALMAIPLATGYCP
jgi:hypothetical protein